MRCLRGGFNFGGEQSGHLIFNDFGTTGDGLVGGVAGAPESCVRKKTSLSKLAQCWTRFPPDRDEYQSA